MKTKTKKAKAITLLRYCWNLNCPKYGQLTEFVSTQTGRTEKIICDTCGQGGSYITS